MEFFKTKNIGRNRSLSRRLFPHGFDFTTTFPKNATDFRQNVGMEPIIGAYLHRKYTILPSKNVGMKPKSSKIPP